MANIYNPYGWQNYTPYQQQQQPIQQINNSGAITVQSEQEARYYPVAPATTVTFRNEKEPFIYTKTVTNSLEPPKFEIYRRINEEPPKNETPFVKLEEFNSFKAEFEELKQSLEAHKKTTKKAVKKMMNNFNQLLNQFKRNPMAALGGMGIPQNIQNDPNAIIQHLLDSGRISQQQLNNAINNAKRMGIK